MAHTTCVNCDAHTPTASDRSAHIVYALYGPSHGRHLEVWNRTWLSGKKFVYVPDAPKGPFAANFRGVHAREKRGASNPASRYRFISDANMLWAAHIANMTFPTARWIMVVDADTFCFDRTLRARTRSLEWRRPIAIGMMGGFGKAYGGVVRRSDASCESVCTKENGDGNYELRLQSPAMRGCCMCPVLPAADSFALSPNGTAYYRPPHFDPYGGTGILLSRGLLDAIPSADWALCTRRLVCGSADFRLNTCISNLHNGTRYLHAHENFDFMSAALRDAISPVENIRYNVFWSTIHKDPVRRPMVLDHFRNGSCPWSMHKLQLNLAPQVYDLARHCM